MAGVIPKAGCNQTERQLSGRRSQKTGKESEMKISAAIGVLVLIVVIGGLVFTYSSVYNVAATNKIMKGKLCPPME